ncbi:MAG: hypothetical protein WD294_00260 [Phycisphaeraceae bacterium]
MAEDVARRIVAVAGGPPARLSVRDLDATVAEVVAEQSAYGDAEVVRDRAVRMLRLAHKAGSLEAVVGDSEPAAKHSWAVMAFLLVGILLASIFIVMQVASDDDLAVAMAMAVPVVSFFAVPMLIICAVRPSFLATFVWALVIIGVMVAIKPDSSDAPATHRADSAFAEPVRENAPRGYRAQQPWTPEWIAAEIGELAAIPLSALLLSLVWRSPLWMGRLSLRLAKGP